MKKEFNHSHHDTSGENTESSDDGCVKYPEDSEPVAASAGSEFNLSEKTMGTSGWVIKTKDVKEFIKLLKEECKIDWDKGNFVLFDVNKRIDKLAGKELI